MARVLRMSWLVVLGIAGALLVTLDLRQAVAQSEAAITPISWLGVTGLAALLGVAVVWGQMQQKGRTQGRQIERLFHAAQTIVPRAEVDQRIQEVRQETQRMVERIEVKIDSLHERFDRRADSGRGETR